jgi:hypothetical protein
VKGGTLGWGAEAWREGERKGYGGVKRIKVCPMYMFEDRIMRITKH